MTNTLNLRVINKAGKVLGRVSTLSVFKGVVSYVNSDDEVITVSYLKTVDIQCSYNNQKWVTVSIPREDDSNMLDDLRIMRRA